VPRQRARLACVHSAAALGGGTAGAHTKTRRRRGREAPRATNHASIRCCMMHVQHENPTPSSAQQFTSRSFLGRPRSGGQRVRSNLLGC
jgi:hypothetical protein